MAGRVQVWKPTAGPHRPATCRAGRAASTDFVYVAVVHEDWYRSEIVGRGPGHPDVPRRYLDKYLLPKLRRLTAADVTPAHMVRLLDGVKHRAPTAANDLLRFARRIFSFGVRRQVVPINPIAEFSPRLDAPVAREEVPKPGAAARGTDQTVRKHSQKRRVSATITCSPSNCCWHCACARANCSAHAGRSLISNVISGPVRSGIYRLRAPRRVKNWISLWCRGWSSGFRLST